MLSALLPSIIGILGSAIDKAIPDKEEAERLKAQITIAAMEQDAKELEGAVKIITAEASGSWLQRSWRPMMMVWFAILIGAHWFGYTPDNLSPGQIEQLFEIVKIGIGGYVIGRSGEKIVKEWKK